MSKVWHARANGGGRRRDFDAELSNTSPRTAYPKISETIIRGAAHDSRDTEMCPLDPALTLLPPPARCAQAAGAVRRKILILDLSSSASATAHHISKYVDISADCGYSGQRRL